MPSSLLRCICRAASFFITSRDVLSLGSGSEEALLSSQPRVVLCSSQKLCRILFSWQRVLFSSGRALFSSRSRNSLASLLCCSSWWKEEGKKEEDCRRRFSLSHLQSWKTNLSSLSCTQGGL